MARAHGLSSILFFPQPGSPPVEWVASDGLTDYAFAVLAMEQHVTAIAAGEAAERVWLVEHPPLYTAGTSAKPEDLIAPERFPVYQTGRGGQFTYHGPGQRVAYVMLDLKRRREDVRAFVCALEEWIIATLLRFEIHGARRGDRIGIWVERPERGLDSEEKIAALGIRMRKWVSFHGIALNNTPNLDHFSGIVPCGLNHHGVTSLADLGLAVPMTALDRALRAAFEDIFGPTVTNFL